MSPTVDRLFTTVEVERLAGDPVMMDWLAANGIDPHDVALRWISVERTAGGQLIRFHAFRHLTSGGGLVDPDNTTRAWTVERTVALTVALPPTLATRDSHRASRPPGG